MKKDRILQVLQIFLKLALVVTTLIYPLFMDLLTALGWTVNAHSYGAKFRILAAVVAVGVLLMTAGVILALCKKDIAALVTGSVGFFPLMGAVSIATSIAEAAGWAPQSEAHLGRFAYQIWADRMLPTIAPYCLLVAVALLHYFSYEASAARREKKRQKEEFENRPAPKIVED